MVPDATRIYRRRIRRAGTVALVVLFSLTCDRSLPTSPESVGPQPAISDAAHQAGNPDFFFLPPIVPDPSGNPSFDADAFDPSQFPEVRICVAAAEGCTAAQPEGFPLAYSMTAGPGSETVRLNDVEQHYLVNWHTDQFVLDESLTYRIRVLIAGTELGYADVDVVNGGNELRNVNTGEYIALKDGRTLPVKFRLEYGAAWTIGPDGGTVSADGERVRLAVPAGAVAEPVGITVRPAQGLFTIPQLVPGTAWDFGPDGLVFAAPAALAIVYDPAAVPAGGTEASLRVHELVDGVWEAVPGSVVDAAANSVSAPIDGFSTYALLIGPPTYRVAFASTRDGDFEIYVTTDQAPLTQLTDNAASDEHPDWSPAGDRLVFQTDRDGDVEIYVMDADGDNARNLTDHPGRDAVPVWSPRGDRIAFVSQRDGAPEVYVMNADGSAQTNLTNDPGRDISPAWSPDGAEIVFASNRNGQYDIYVMDADGTNVRNLTADPAWDMAPAWSPDGSQIAFASDRDGRYFNDYGIHVMAADGGNPTAIGPRSFGEYNPTWSPSGAWLAFERFMQPPASVGDVYVMPAGGGSVRALVAEAADERQPSWGGVARLPVRIALSETIAVNDQLVAAVDRPVAVTITESIAIMDATEVVVKLPVVIAVSEAIAVADVVGLAVNRPVVISVVETIQVSDAVGTAVR